MAPHDEGDGSRRSSSGSSSSTAASSRRHCDSSNIQVAVRVRPLSANEQVQGSEPCVSVAGSHVLLGGDTGKQFEFDAVFPVDVEQQFVYESLIAPLLDRFFDGYNATVFTYGQTGSGKTFTMGNEFKLSVASADRGIVPRVMDDIFRTVVNAPESKNIIVKVSYLEILNEEIYDLLSDASNNGSASASAGLAVRDEGKRGIVVTGLSEHQVESITEVASLLQAGALQRATASTTMNAQSSRSHAICTLTMEQHDTVNEGVEARYSKFHLVDLAGSERAKRTNAEGARFKEGVNINRGLLSLGNVINALSGRSRTNSSSIHIPYRDSKLTRLLQDSLGGNSKTLMIACVSPADINFEETSNTLRYASRARNIENKAVVNKEMSATNEVSYLKQQVELLQLQLLQQSKQQMQRRCVTVSEESNVDRGDLETELQKWKEVARTREEELRIVMSAREKWKKVADELMTKKKTSTPMEPKFGGRNAPTTPVSAASAMAEEALEFDKSFSITLVELASPAEVTSSASQAQMQLDLDNLSEVIAEKEKILRELVTLPSNGVTEVRLAALATSYEKEIIELEKRVGKLTAEKKRLSLEIERNDQSANATERQSKGDVRAQLQAIQRQLQVAKQAEKECKRLSALWKTGKFKISTLEVEIVGMKKQKASLQRKLKEASEVHRKEKREQDLKIMQLKRQDQRKQYELQKLSALHSKQSNVLKRKTEEVAMANKRMRTMALQQQQAQKMQKGTSSLRCSLSSDGSKNTGEESNKVGDAEVFIEGITPLLERTFEIQTTIYGAKAAIQVDLEERKKLALEISQLESNPPKNANNSDKLASLKSSLREKNAEIRLLQQKMISVERNNALPTELFPVKASACHQMIKYLMESAVESKAACMELENTKAALDAVEEQLVTQADKYEHTIAELKKDAEELGHRAGTSLNSLDLGSSKAPREQDAGKDALQQELDATKKELAALRQQIADKELVPKKKPAQKKKVEEVIAESDILSSSEDDNDSDDSGDDSDYIENEGKQAAKRKASFANKQARQSGGGSGNVMDEIDELLAEPSRAGVPVCCSCNGKCATKGCACKAEKQTCGSECACNASKCHNREGFQAAPKRRKSAKSGLVQDDKESEVESFFHVSAAIDKEDMLPPSSLTTYRPS
ncbi:Kinesin family member 4 isoform 2 putati, partial [Globisporangium splendens]